MRKIMSLFFIMFSVIVLSGCGLVPEEIIEQSLAQLCLDDPSNELCTIDSLDSIEESVVLGMVNGVLENLDDVDFEEYCVQYLSETDADLVDDCIAQTTAFLPEAVGMATAIEASKDGDVYTLKVETDTPYEYFMIEVTVGSVDGTTKILTWSVGTVYVDEVELTNDAQLELINNFFMALGDSAESTSALCGEYYDGIDNDCDDIDDFDRSGELVIVSVTPLGENGYEVVYTVDGNQMTTTLYLDSDDDGDSIIVEIEHEESQVDGYVVNEEAEQMIRDFVRDYQDIDYSFEELNDMYFMNMLEPDFFDGRMESLELGFMMTITNLLPGDDGWYDLTVEIVVDGMTESSDVKIRVNRIDMALYLELDDGEDNDCDGVCVVDDEAVQFIIDFLADFDDPTVSDEEIVTTYLMGVDDGNIIDGRMEALELGYSITVLNLYQVENGFYLVEVEITYDSEVMTTSLRVRVNRIDMALYLEIDEDYEEECMSCVTYDEAQVFINDFFVDFTNAELSLDDFNTLYMNGTISPTIMEEREMYTNGTYELFFIYMYSLSDNTYEFQMDVFVDGEPVDYLYYTVMMYFDEEGMIAFDIYESPSYEPLSTEEMFALYQTFLNDYYNGELSNQELAELYFYGYTPLWVSFNRGDELLSGEVVELLNLTNVDGYGYYEIELRKTVGEVITEYFVYASGYSYGTEIQLYVNDPINDYLYSSFYYFDQMIQDDTYTVEEVCATLDSASADLCTAIVTFHRTNSYSLQLDHYEYSEVDGLIVYVFTYDSNYDVVEVNEFRLVNTNIENPLYIESTENTTNPLYE